MCALAYCTAACMDWVAASCLTPPSGTATSFRVELLTAMVKG